MHLLLLSPLVASLALAAPPTAQELSARYEKENSPVWCDGDTATFFYQGDAQKVQARFDRQVLALHRLPNSAVWVRMVHRPELEKAVFSYSIVAVPKPGEGGGRAGFSNIWRGPKARPEPETIQRLEGTVRTELFDSESLGEERRVHIYLPPGHQSATPCPVIYGTDGRLNAQILEPLILSGKIPPVMVVASEAAHGEGRPAAKPGNAADSDPRAHFMDNDLRGQEYAPGWNDERFSRHEKFFCRELVRWAEKEFNASRKPGERAVMGCSFGARFAVEMGVRHPEMFGHVFAFSTAGFFTGVIPRFDPAPAGVKPPDFYLAAGTWETLLYPMNKNVIEGLRRAKFPAVFSLRVGGHDDAWWRDEFVVAVTRTFGRK